MPLALPVVSAWFAWFAWLMSVPVMSLPPINSERGRLPQWETAPLVCKFGFAGGGSPGRRGLGCAAVSPKARWVLGSCQDSGFRWYLPAAGGKPGVIVVVVALPVVEIGSPTVPGAGRTAPRVRRATRANSNGELREAQFGEGGDRWVRKPTGAGRTAPRAVRRNGKCQRGIGGRRSSARASVSGNADPGDCYVREREMNAVRRRATLSAASPMSTALQR